MTVPSTAIEWIDHLQIAHLTAPVVEEIQRRAVQEFITSTRAANGTSESGLIKRLQELGRRAETPTDRNTCLIAAQRLATARREGGL